MRKKTDTIDSETRARDLLKLENEKTRKWFMSPFYSMAPVPVALAIEFFVKSKAVASAATALIVLCVMVSLVIYSQAMFKAYHNLLYHDDRYCQRVESVPSWKIVLLKLCVSTAWFIVFVAVVLMIFFIHSQLLERMPSNVMDAEVISSAVGFVDENFGKDIYLTFSMVSIFFQAITLISIAYVAASASHVKFCVRYKTLAGIFVFVAMYFFENDFATVIKRMMIRLWGGVENVMSHDVVNSIEILMMVEAISYILVIMLNAAITCYLLKRKYKE